MAQHKVVSSRGRARRKARQAVAAGVAALTATVGGIGALAATAHPASAEVYKFGPGYWLASSDGGVFAYGHAAFNGTPAKGAPLHSSIVSLVATPSGAGYWMASADGGVFTYGDAEFHGSAGDVPLAHPIVGMATTPGGRGYWLVGSDGGVFAYGDAGFYGGASNVALQKPIVAIAATPSGLGYWLVSADGGVFAYGDAVFSGSPNNEPLRAPIAGIASTSDGYGYWLVAADGGVFAYGDAVFYGSPTAANLRRPIVGMTTTPSGRGYWLVSQDGGVFAYGDAGYFGSMANHHMTGRVVSISGRYAPAQPQKPIVTPLTSNHGYDISWPQCDAQTAPAPPYGFGVVGVTGGKAFTKNDCLAGQWHWAKSYGSGASVYMNLNYPSDGGWGQGATGPNGTCQAGDNNCALANFGANAVRDAVAYGNASGVKSPMWWLDVETVNTWSADVTVNARIVQGAIDELRREHLNVGIYSTGYQFRLITGGYSPGIAVWIAGAPDLNTAADWCNGGFGGGTAWLVQTLPIQFDENIACAPVMAHPEWAFNVTTYAPAPTTARPIPRVE